MRRRAKVFLIIGAFIAGGLVLLQTPLLRQAREAAWQIVVAATGRAFRVGQLEAPQDITDQLNKLRAENVQLNAELADYRRLRTQLDVAATQDYRQIPAAIVGRPIDTFRSQYVINRGANDGVILGSPAVTQGATLMGLVTELSSDTAVVQLLFHPATNLTAEVARPEGAEGPLPRGLVVGERYTSLALTTVPRDAMFESNMPVVTVAREGVIPYGLVIGHVGEIRSTESEAYQSASLKLSFDPDRLDALTILVP